MSLQSSILGLLSICQAQFLPGASNTATTNFPANNFASPSFAGSSLPSVPLPFPSGFTQQNLNLPDRPKEPKRDQASGYTLPTKKIPRDPNANATLTTLLTSSNNKVVDGKGAAEIKALFDQDSFRSFNIELTMANKNIMNQDPTKETIVHCRLTTDYNTPQAHTYSDFSVGCGYKGSVGSLRVCFDENGHDNHICRKLSVRVDARAFPSNGSSPLIDGLESMFFGGMPVDLSLVSERTSFYLMNSLGMTASYSTHAKLFLNGRYLGIYSFLQPVDEQFTKMHFPKDDRKGKGGLYKELWLNPLHIKDVKASRKSGPKQDDSFINQVMNAVLATPLSGNAPQQFFDKYFDVQSLIDMTAYNTAIGSTDDWRQRHNFFLYVRQNKKQKQLVFIPWDYDRLYDAGSETRGALKGKPWWDIQNTATPAACNAPIVSTQQQASSMGGTPAKIAWNKDILDQFPLDVNIPVTCDKMTQLMAYALGPRIRQRTREIASAISMTRVRQLWSAWNNQIKTAVENDPSGPSIATMLSQQQLLDQHLTKSISSAIVQANAGDLTFSTSSIVSSPYPNSSPFAGQSAAFNSFATPSFATPAQNPFAFSAPAFAGKASG